MNCDLIQAKPEHLIGISTGFSLVAFKSMFDRIIKFGGKTPDSVLCGSKAVAEDAYSAAEILGYKLQIICDEELSPKRFWIMHSDDLSDFRGGGQN